MAGDGVAAVGCIVWLAVVIATCKRAVAVAHNEGGESRSPISRHQ